jgi:hypothetical protein
MCRVTIFLAVLILSSCKPGRLDSVFQNVRSDAQVIEGVLAMQSSRRIRDCTRVAKDRVLNKLLDEGFERTAVWRPSGMRSKDLDAATRSRLYENIYISGLSQDKRGKQCRCQFQLNLASTRKILEHENLIPPFGY